MMYILYVVCNQTRPITRSKNIGSRFRSHGSTRLLIKVSIDAFISPFHSYCPGRCLETISLYPLSLQDLSSSRYFVEFS